jgi:glycosyltransferase involved in cell wall biosynthesis
MTKVLGLLRVKNEERFIRDVIAAADFCDDILVFDDHSTDKTREIASEFSNVWIIKSPFLETPNWVEEGRDRTYHAIAAQAYNPEWIAQINGDEIFEPDTARKIAPFLDRPEIGIIETHCLTYWDDEDTLRVDGHFAQSFRQTFWRYPKGGDLTYGFAHDSLPNTAKGYTRTREANVAFWHYGGIDVDRRRLRSELYRTIDPYRICSDWRIMMQGDPDGPPKSQNLTGEPFRTQSVIDYLNSVGNIYSRRPCSIAAKLR